MGKERLKSFLEEVGSKEQQQLALMAPGAAEYDSRKHSALEELGLTRSNNFKKSMAAKEKVITLGKAREKSGFIEEVTNYLSEKITWHNDADIAIISLEKLVEYCRKYDILFGKANLFKGNIPDKVVDAIVGFNFNSLKTYGTINTNNTIISFFKNHDNPIIYIASSPHNFEGNKAIISNKEVIESHIHPTLSNLKKTMTKDNFLMSPLVKEDKIYFVIIKIW